MELGIKIKEYLKEKGISQTFLSSKAHIELPKLNLSLNGKRRLTLEEYENVCWALDLNTDYFLKPKPPR